MSEQPEHPKILAEDMSFEEFVKRYDGFKVEWNAGKVIQKPPKNEIHQVFLGIIHTLFFLYLSKTQVGRVFLHGYQMFIGDDKPAHQPDLLIVLKAHYDRIKPEYLDGAADVIVEILSPATGATDRGLKFEEYETARVAEYWLIEPDAKRMYLYVLNAEGYYKLQQPDATRYSSQVLKGFILDSAWLWRDELPAGQELIDIVQAMN